MGRNALLSVYDKSGIVEFARELSELNFTIYASGGTYKHLQERGVLCLPVARLVGGEAILGHRVVTLSREVHAGLLARNTHEDVAELASLAIPRIDLVCVDLYPLQAEINREGSAHESIIEQTDIGGPTMIRSAVKGGRVVLCDPKDRERVLDYYRNGEQETLLLEELAAKGEFVVARYVMASAEYRSAGKFRGIFGTEVAVCKYGENAHQKPASLYSTMQGDDPLALDQFTIVAGTTPSYNTWVDLDRLLQTITHIAEGFALNSNAVPSIAVGGKHGNPCGAAMGENPNDVLERMMWGDPLAIFGGLIITNIPITEEHIEILGEKLLDGIIAPSFTQGAISALRRKGDKCRFISNAHLRNLNNSLDRATRFRYVRGGFLLQPNYEFVPNFGNGEIVKHGEAPPEMEKDMLLAWAVGSTSNSNTITLVKNGSLIGNGVGQQDRVGAAQLAIARARRSNHDLRGSVAYSDSFFPFPDGPQTLIEAGVQSIFTTSGSVKDQAIIDLCKQWGVPLYMVPDQVGRGFFGH